MSKERIDPYAHEDLYAVDHLLRYTAITPWIHGKRVLDAACGTGFGSLLMLRNGAAQVIGVDVSQAAIDQCQQELQATNLDFTCSGLEDLSALQLEPFDCVVSFETLEHVREPWICLDSLTALLKPNGILLLSVPGETDQDQNNEFHLHHYKREELHGRLRAKFKYVHCYAQKFQVMSALRPTEQTNNQPIEFKTLSAMHIALTGEPEPTDTYLFLASNEPVDCTLETTTAFSRNAWLNLARERAELYNSVEKFTADIKALHRNFKIEFAKNSDLIRKFTNALAWGQYHYEQSYGRKPEQPYMDAILAAQSEREKVLQARVHELEAELESLRQPAK